MNSKTSKTLPFHIIITLSMLLIFGLLSSCASTADVVGDGDYSEDSISQNAQDGNDMMTINEIDDLFSKYEGKEIWVSDISIYVADITNSCFRANIYDECDVYIEFANNNEFNVVKALFYDTTSSPLTVRGTLELKDGNLTLTDASCFPKSMMDMLDTTPITITDPVTGAVAYYNSGTEKIGVILSDGTTLLQGQDF